GIKISKQHVTVRDGAQIRVRIYAPKEISSDGHPVYIAFHGGGFALGNIEMYDLHRITWAGELGVVSVNVDYRLAPEFTFPYAIHDSWDATKWVAANAATIGGNLRKGFIVGGVSAGGNIAAVMSQLARDEKLSPPVTAIHLSIPDVIAPSVGKEKYPEQYLSREQNKHSIVLNAEDMDFFQSISVPLDTCELGGLPSAYFQICGMDPLRDEALIYKEKLYKEGIQTKSDIYSGVPHAF
ncbi:Alpha/Beta hydrolase protein, partial [Bisporella sp. PMI_857]